MPPRLTSRTSGAVLTAALCAGLGSGVYFIYQRVALGNPMRVGFDADGVWGPVSREQHLTEKVHVSASPLSPPAVIYSM
jgi:hypothetical protein